MIDSPSTPSPHSGIRVSVRLFARYAELLGTDRVDLEVPQGATVAEVVAATRERPGGTTLPGSLLVARNLVQTGLETVVEDGDEIALLPPMAGG